MRTIAPAFLIAACASHAPAPVPTPLPVPLPDAAAPEPAPPPDAGPPPLAWWAPDAGDAAHVWVQAIDADGQALFHLLARGVDFIEPVKPSVRVTGRLAVADFDAARAALLALHPELAVTDMTPDTTAPTVDLDARAPARDVFRLLGDVLRENVVVAPGDLPDLDVHVSRENALVVLEGAIGHLGLVSQTDGDITYVHAKGTPEPDVKLAIKKGPTVTALVAEDARAGELDALLAALGAKVADADCQAGDPIELTLHRAPPGAAAAVIAALGGSPSGTCVAKVGALPDDGTLIATASTAKQRAAIFRVGDRDVIVRGSKTVEIGEGRVVVHGVTQQLPGDAAAPPAADDERDIVANGRLAATVSATDGGAALFEYDDAWYALHDAQITVLDASVVYQGPDGTVSATLR